MNFSLKDVERAAYSGVLTAKHRLLPNFHLSDRTPAIRRLNQAAAHVLHRDVVRVDGHIMHLHRDDGTSNWLNTTNTCEPTTSALIARLTPSGGITIDLGGHIGWHSLRMARAVGPQGRVYSFEPDPENFALLQKNIAANGYANVITVPSAVGDHNGSVELFLSTINRGDHSIHASSEGRRSEKVAIVRLDDYTMEHSIGPVSFVKMDIQGSEVGALRGMTQLLDEKRNPGLKLVIEYEPLNFRRAGHRPEDLLLPLLSKGFQIYEVDEQKRHIVPTTIEALEKRHPANGDDSINLLFSRQPVSFSLK